MAITLGALVLPPELVWEDEDAWSPVAQTTEYSLTGALLVEEAVKLAGRPITLAGQKEGEHYKAWVARSQSFQGCASRDALRAALLVANAVLTLTLHDGRQFRVAPRHDGDGPLKMTPLAVFKSFAPANPGSGTLYAVDAIRLIEIPA